jgi:hypothetical protein
MWEVKNMTPFAAAGYFVRDRDGAEHWAIAARARFSLSPDDFPCITDQLPVRLSPEYSDDAALELKAEADLTPFRPHPDIILRGSVWPPSDGAHSRLLALRIGPMEKLVAAFSKRHARRQNGKWRVTTERFTPFALSWRYALGGRDVLAAPDTPDSLHPGNPIGVGWSPRMGAAPDETECQLPRLERPKALLHPDKPPPLPAGFGPLQPGWQPRLARAGTYDDAWREERAPLPPTDFSEAFHQAAPDDQIYRQALRGGEPVELDGFHPDGVLSFQLPQIILAARTRICGVDIDSRLRIVAVEIDGTARTLDIVWNMAVPCPGGDHLVERTTILLRQMAGVAR